MMIITCHCLGHFNEFLQVGMIFIVARQAQACPRTYPVPLDLAFLAHFFVEFESVVKPLPKLVSAYKWQVVFDRVV